MDLLLDGLADQRIDSFMRMNQEIVGGGIRSSLTPTSINNLKKNERFLETSLNGADFIVQRLEMTGKTILLPQENKAGIEMRVFRPSNSMILD